MSRIEISKILGRAYRALWLAVLLLVLLLVFMFVFAWKTETVAVTTDEHINSTPISIEKMRKIGEWEFLALSDEEMVDTVAKHLLSKNELIRVYYGELRVGVDMNELTDDSFVVRDDTIVINLPPVKLLDERFIDEAKTKTFYESGSWSGKDLEKLYEKAKLQMKARCLTEANMKTARDNAKSSVETMLIALGIEKFIVNAR